MQEKYLPSPEEEYAARDSMDDRQVKDSLNRRENMADVAAGTHRFGDTYERPNYVYYDGIETIYKGKKTLTLLTSTGGETEKVWHGVDMLHEIDERIRLERELSENYMDRLQEIRHRIKEGLKQSSSFP
jgi:hypothetical protein